MGAVMVREASADRPARRAASEGQRQTARPSAIARCTLPAAGLVGHLAETRGAAPCAKASTALVSPLGSEVLLADVASHRVAEQVVLAERAHGDSTWPRGACPLQRKP